MTNEFDIGEQVIDNKTKDVGIVYNVHDVNGAHKYTVWFDSLQSYGFYDGSDITSYYWPEDDDFNKKLKEAFGEEPAFCYHRWEHYIGFTEEYDFCVNCGKKFFKGDPV